MISIYEIKSSPGGVNQSICYFLGIEEFPSVLNYSHISNCLAMIT